MLENKQPGHQPRRQRRLPGSHPTHRAEASRQKVPIDLPRQPHQRMAKVDDLLEKRAKQVVLAIVAWLAHRSPPTANLAVEGITDHPNRESQTARKPACTPGFLAKSITCSGQIIAIDQSLPHSSRTTNGGGIVRGDLAGRPRQGCYISSHFHEVNVVAEALAFSVRLLNYLVLECGEPAAGGQCAAHRRGYLQRNECAHALQPPLGARGKKLPRS